MTVPATVNVVNTEGTIITRLKEALETTTYKGECVFKRITASTDPAQIMQTMFKSPDPYCGILATMGDEGRGIPNRRDIRLDLTLYVAAKFPSTIDETGKTIEKFRLANLLKNIVESATEVNDLAAGIPDDENFHRPGPIWDTMSDVETASAKSPWIAFTLPVTYGFPVDGVTAR